MASLLGELRSSLEALYGDNLVGVRLFGSYARRQATPDSDVDVLLVLRELEDYGTEVGRVRDLLSRLSMQYGKTVAPVFVDANRFSAARLLAVPPEELAARYGIDLERPPSRTPSRVGWHAACARRSACGPTSRRVPPPGVLRKAHGSRESGVVAVRPH